MFSEALPVLFMCMIFLFLMEILSFINSFLLKIVFANLFIVLHKEKIMDIFLFSELKFDVVLSDSDLLKGNIIQRDTVVPALLTFSTSSFLFNE